MTDHYRTLRVARTASADAIKLAYRQLAREHHPDHHGGDKRKEERLKQINGAYAVLGDPRQRAAYDRSIRGRWSSSSSSSSSSGARAAARPSAATGPGGASVASRPGSSGPPARPRSWLERVVSVAVPLAVAVYGVYEAARDRNR